jgi:hypothetical protein
MKIKLIITDKESHRAKRRIFILTSIIYLYLLFVVFVVVGWIKVNELYFVVRLTRLVCI